MTSGRWSMSSAGPRGAGAALTVTALLAAGVAALLQCQSMLRSFTSWRWDCAWAAVEVVDISLNFCHWVKGLQCLSLVSTKEIQTLNTHSRTCSFCRLGYAELQKNTSTFLMEGHFAFLLLGVIYEWSCCEVTLHSEVDRIHRVVLTRKSATAYRYN